MNVRMKPGVAEKFRGLLEQEGDDAVVRIREAKIGSGWKSVIVLRASIDEREDEDVETEVDSVPFVISEEIADQYGRDYAISLDEHGMPVIEASPG